jgi:CDP-glycerol glycerophosphotransferase (TagB/SpsB family)
MKFRYIIKQITLLPLHVLGTFGYMISFFYPKDKNIWIFGSWFGKKFSDNSMHFFKYMLKEHPEISSVWITKDEMIYERLKKEDFPVQKSNSLKGIYIQLKAGVGVITAGKYDVNQNFVSGQTKIIQLWHGIPLKKIGFDTYIGKLNDSLVRHLFFLPVLRSLLKFDIVLSTSGSLSERFAKAFRLKPDQVPVTGYPRNDVFFDYNKKDLSVEKIILYAPTHRNEGLEGKVSKVISIEKMTGINEELKKLNAKMYIKLHFTEEHKIEELNMANVVLLKSDPFFDIQEFLCRTDLLITDYSSVYFDYLLLDRPIIFFAYDLEDYVANDRGFYEKYEDVTPGDLVKDWDGAINSIKKCINDPDRFKTERKLLREKYWEFQDGKSSERVYQEIMRIL